MADNDTDRLLGDDDEDTGDDENVDSTDSDSDDEQPGATVEVLQTQLRDLTTRLDQRDKQMNDLLASVGRVRSAQAALEKSHGENSAEAKRLQASLKGANTAIDAVLGDPAIDPAIRSRVDALRAQMERDSEIEELKQQVAATTRSRQDTVVPEQDSGPSPFERAMELAIRTSGLDPDSDLFDWAGEASRILRINGEQAATAYFSKQIAAGLEAKAAGTRRQARKAAGSAGAKSDNSAGANPLTDGSLEERMAHLRRIGAM